jgi:hypothetical protein
MSHDLHFVLWKAVEILKRKIVFFGGWRVSYSLTSLIWMTGCVLV